MVEAYIDGIDYAWGRPSPTAIVNTVVETLGSTDYLAKFVCRYASQVGNAKDLTHDEAVALTQAGLLIVSVWEYTGRENLGGYNEGMTDAQEAVAELTACGMPQDRPIYFAVDYDMTSADDEVFIQWLHGIARIIGWDRVGVYGGLHTVSVAHDAGVKWLWQTQAWSGGVWHPAANIHQFGSQLMVDGVECDRNTAHTLDYGGWQVANVEPAVEPVSVPIVSNDPNNYGGHGVSGWPVLTIGSNGQYVKNAQGLLVGNGQNIAVDGIFGPATAAATRAMQQTFGIAVDGMFGPQTLEALLRVKF